MKRFITPLLFLSLLAFVFSCDDSFLEENKKVIDSYTLESPLYVNPTNVFTEVSATLPDLKNREFNVVQYPTIIQFESLKGRVDESGNLTFKIKVNQFDSPVNIEPLVLGYIVLHIHDFGQLAIPVCNLNLGTPSASLSETLFDFGISRQSQSLSIINSAEGYLWYKMTSKPSWISLKDASDTPLLEINEERILAPHSFDGYQVFPDVSNLEPGDHEGEIVFETTDPLHPLFIIDVKINVRSYENPESLVSLEGDVVDAAYDRISNRLFVLTKNPEKLIRFDIPSGDRSEITFDKSVNCFHLPEDGNNIYVGMSEKMDVIDAATMAVIRGYPVDFNIHSLLYDGDGSVYMTRHHSGWLGEERLHKMELQTGVYTTWKISDLYENTKLKKIKGKSEFLATRETVTPNGVIWVDFSTGIPELKRYWHTSLGNTLWMSENQQYLYSGYGTVYLSPTPTTGENLTEVGQLKIDGNQYYHYLCFEHVKQSGSIWASHDKNDWRYKNVVVEFDDGTYAKRREIELNDYVTTYQGRLDYYKTLARYIFLNHTGDQLILLKNIKESDARAWHLEVIDVSN